MNINEHIIRIDFSIAYCNSDSKTIKGTEQEFVVLFNNNVISEETVNELINSGMYENDQRIVIMTKLQADNLLGTTKEAAAKQLFLKSPPLNLLCKFEVGDSVVLYKHLYAIRYL